MTSNAFRADGLGSISLDAILAHAGEGTIREVHDHPGAVAKVFHPDLKNLPEKSRKVAAMVRNRPNGAVQKDGFVVLTWPTHILRESGTAIGYLMPRIDTTNAVEIHQISNPSHHADPLPVGGRGCPWCAIDGERTHRRSERIPATPVPSRRTLHAGPPPDGVPATGTRVTPAQRVFLCGAAILGVLAVAIAAIIMLVG